MNDKIRDKMYEYYWDYGEIVLIYGQEFVDSIYDCDLNYLYYTGGCMDAEGNKYDNEGNCIFKSNLER